MSREGVVVQAGAPSFRKHGPVAAVRSNRASAWKGLAEGTAKVDSTNGCHIVRQLTKFDPGAMRRALEAVVPRHPVLGARVEIRDRTPWIVAHPPRIDFPTTRLPPTDPDRREAVAGPAVAGEIWRPFDLGQPGLWRAFAFRAADDDFRWGLVVHHFVIDRMGLRVLVDELEKAYRDGLARRPVDLPPVGLTYEDYLLSLEDWAETPEGRRQREWWRRRLRHLPRLATPAPAPDAPDRDYFELDPETTALARACAREMKTTLFIVLLAAQMLTLAPFSSSSWIGVKVVTDGREAAGLRGVVGNLADRLFVLVDLAEVRDFAGLVRAVHDQWLAARRRAFVRFDTVQADAKADGGSIAAPVFNFHPAGAAPARRSAAAGLASGTATVGAGLSRPPGQTRPGVESGPYWLEMHDRGQVLTGHVRHGLEQRAPDFLDAFATALARGCRRPHDALGALERRHD